MRALTGPNLANALRQNRAADVKDRLFPRTAKLPLKERILSKLGLITFATGLALLGSYAAASITEKWVCGIPTLVDRAHINLFDFDILGNQLVVHGPVKGANRRQPILRNDDWTIVFQWLDTFGPPSFGVIDKQLGSFKVYDEAHIADYGGVEGLISAQGSCQRFERESRSKGLRIH
jgi:hypothetical protein